MKICFRHQATRFLFALIGVSTICWIIVLTGVLDYWTWILVRRATLDANGVQKPKWEQLTGKRMAEYVKPFTHNVLLQPNSTTEMQLENPFAIIFVITSPEAKERRMWIRNTWYKWKNTHNLTIIFFTGIRDDFNFTKTNHSLQAESEVYQDIVMDDFVERYYALPIKVLRVMKFYLKKYEESSHRLPFFIKVDDDVFFNVPNLLSELQSQSSRVNSNNGFVGGHIHQFSKVNNNHKSKYYIPYNVWDGYWFPAYAAGPCYMISGNLIRRIYEKSLDMMFFPFEDVFITGIVANLELGFRPVDVKGITLFFSRELTDEELVNSVALAPSKISEEFMDKCFQRLTRLILR